MLGIGEIGIGILTLAVFVVCQRVTMSIYWFQQFAGQLFIPAFRRRQYPFHLLIATDFYDPLMAGRENNRVIFRVISDSVDVCSVTASTDTRRIAIQRFQFKFRLLSGMDQIDVYTYRARIQRAGQLTRIGSRILVKSQTSITRPDLSTSMIWSRIVWTCRPPSLR